MSDHDHQNDSDQTPKGTIFVVAVVLVSIFLMWFLVLGVLQGRS